MVTPEEMRAIDAAATVPTSTLIARAGWAVAHEVIRRGGAYGRRVAVVAGPGNNGADGRIAAEVLRRRGAVCDVFETSNLPARLPACDVVIDAAFGTGLRDPWQFPACDAPVTVAVDIPSGVDGLTGRAHGGPRPADVTVTFAAAKPGLYCNDGRRLSGEVVVADIGLPVGATTLAVVEPSDVAAALPARERDAHKWQHAVWVVAGSDGMRGAGALCSAAAMRSAASYVRWSPVGVVGDAGVAGYPEIVGAPVDPVDLATTIAAEADRFRALVVGPGLGRRDGDVEAIRDVAATAPIPTVLDADALWAVGSDPLPFAASAGARIMTPHDGEFAFLMGQRPGDDRIAAARSLAVRHDVVALLKGPATIVAAPDGRVRVVASGDERLATAGTGDVLAGCIGGFLSLGADAFDAAWSASMVCALASHRRHRSGMVASDLLASIPPVLTEVRQ